MQKPSSPRRRAKVAAGLSLATALAATGVTVALAQSDETPGNEEAVAIAADRSDATPEAHRDAWLGQVGDYVEQETARRYAVAVYGNLANWHAVGQYADALAAQAAAASSYTGSSGSSTLDAIRACESGGDYSAVSSSGTYRGAYQFDYATWQSVGGSGDPAAASPAEQDMRAQMLYEQSGSSPWPVCGQ